ncbi:MAG: RNA polymerase sigma factor, partial [Limisphaerales bacterium]
MPEPDDIALLKQYAGGDESAFTALFERHVHLVYSAALRQARNPSHAEEVTQAVFILLARKAKSLSPKTVLSGWLYQAARLTTASLIKREIRRQRREQEMYMQTLTEPDTSPWEQISPLLDDAMGRLGEKDRNAIVLRFFENKTPQEAAAALKLNEVTARKRVSRALEKLRTFFAKRGVVLTTAIIAGAISANSVQAAPLAMAKTVTAVAVAKGATASISTLTLIKGALK